MIKRTLYFGNPAYLSLDNGQLLVRLPQVEKNIELPEKFKKESVASIPVEDIGVVLLDHKQITTTHSIINALLDNNVAIIYCDDSHHPSGLLLPLAVNHIQSERFSAQVATSIPLKKQLWQQTIIAKILNQAAVLEASGISSGALCSFAKSVKSGDTGNCEGSAARFYWHKVFPEIPHFFRDRFGLPPNNLLNYGYAILRAIVARSLVGSGLLPTLGIHHHNRYNAYCLADDIMEPFRPFVDATVKKIMEDESDYNELTTELKRSLLQIPVIDILIDGERSPLMIGVQRTTASLARCFEGKSKKILYPEYA